MNRAGRVIEPSSPAVRRYHDARYRVFQRMYEDQLAYRETMKAAFAEG